MRHPNAAAKSMRPRLMRRKFATLATLAVTALLSVAPASAQTTR